MLTLYKPSFLCFLTFWRHITFVLFLPFLAEWIFSFLWLGLSGAHLTSHIVTSALSSWARTIEKFLTTRGTRPTVQFTTVRITTVRLPVGITTVQLPLQIEAVHMTSYLFDYLFEFRMFDNYLFEFRISVLNTTVW